MIEFKGNFCLVLRSFGPPSRAMVDYHLERGGMPLHDAIGVNVKRVITTQNQGAGVWYTGYEVLGDCVGVI